MGIVRLEKSFSNHCRERIPEKFVKDNFHAHHPTL